ncbi:MAG TPA: hypothetical protein VGJ85_02130 [Candidatus Nanopelagicaceae bacterium]|jgi:hypothetical protein
MLTFIPVSIALLALTVYIVRRIIKLPSRYERRPRDLSPWNALDQGIDPSIPKEPEA